MSDYIVHASGAGNQVRIFAASTRDLVEKARGIKERRFKKYRFIADR